MSVLSLDGVSAGYGGEPVIRGVSLTVRDGEFCALLGLNGSGKTTLLKSVCGLLPVKSGECLVDGLDCSALNERKRAKYITYLPQRFSSMNVSVLDAVLMGFTPKLGALEFPSAADKALALETLKKMGLEHFVREDFSALSEGQKQLVILARALVQDTPVMLMDEPDSALDFLNRHKILSTIRQLIHSENKAGLITLHDPNLALRYCDSLVLLSEGKIISALSLADASKDSIQTRLSMIYGNIEIIEYRGRFLVIP